MAPKRCHTWGQVSQSPELHGTGDSADVKREGPGGGEVVLGHPGGPTAITRVLIGGRQEGQSQGETGRRRAAAFDHGARRARSQAKQAAP